MTNRLNWIQDEIRTLQEAGLFNRIRTLGSPQGAWLTVDGKNVLNFCSNNYLGLANDPRLVAGSHLCLAEIWRWTWCCTLHCRHDGNPPGIGETHC